MSNDSNKNFYVHVPGQDNTMPGAFFRLGSYSDTELFIQNDTKKTENYYPEAYRLMTKAEQESSDKDIEKQKKAITDEQNKKIADKKAELELKYKNRRVYAPASSRKRINNELNKYKAEISAEYDKKLADCIYKKIMSIKATEENHGIMLSSDGKFLLKTLDVAAIHAKKDISVKTNENVILDVDKKLTLYTGGTTELTANDNITIKTNYSKNITISADDGKGNVKQKSYKETRQVFGTAFDYKESETYEIKLGKSVAFSGSMALDFKGSLSAEFKASASFSLALGLSIGLNPLALKFDWSLMTVKGSKSHFELDLLKLKFSNVSVDAAAADVKKKELEATLTTLKADRDALKVSNSDLIAKIDQIESKMSATDVEIKGIKALI